MCLKEAIRLSNKQTTPNNAIIKISSVKANHKDTEWKIYSLWSFSVAESQWLQPKNAKKIHQKPQKKGEICRERREKAEELEHYELGDDGGNGVGSEGTVAGGNDNGVRVVRVRRRRRPEGSEDGSGVDLPLLENGFPVGFFVPVRRVTAHACLLALMAADFLFS